MKTLPILLIAAAAVLPAQQAPKPATARAATAKPAGGKAAAGKPAAHSAFNKPVFEAYLRHLYVWPPPIEIEIGDPTPAPMPGFQAVRIRASQGKASQEETFYVSKDGQKIIRGQVFDIAQNPFKADIDRLKTEFQPGTGTPGAPVVLVEFSDFQCSYCREEAKILRENLLKEYPKQVRFYYLDFPLEAVHPWSKIAAIAGRCIFKQNANAFWVFHDWIFEHQGEITVENIKAKVLDFAKDKDVDSVQLARCLDTKATEADVDKTIEQGKAAGVDRTPTLFINGRKLVGAADWGELKRIIDFEIEYQKTAKNAGEDCGCEVKLPTPGFK